MSQTQVAVLQRRGRFWVAEPFFARSREVQGSSERPLARQLTLHSNRLAPPRKGSAREGELVLVRVPYGGARGARGRARGPGRAEILRALGSPHNPRDVIEAAMLDRGLARQFDPAVQREARAVASSPVDQELPRRDLRDLPTLTIDPSSARDFDDAISAERLQDGGVRVWVHIADVTAYVREGSQLDREARRRATSIYVPCAVEPMLPHELSSEACSLLPGQERCTVTVELEVRAGKALGSAFYRSLIRSDQRLDYEQVDEIFAGRQRASAPWGQALQAAREAARQLGAARASRAGALELDAPEPQFSFDQAGNVAEVAGQVQTESHRLIEHLMIAANEAVAQLLQRRGVPCLYRVHERPRPERVSHLVDQLRSLGIQTPPVPERMSPSQASELIGEIGRGVESHLRGAEARARAGDASIPATGGRLALTSLVLRSLQQAVYSPRNIGHAGLGSDCYCHFTSPIRRYPDIVCHRALLSAIGAGEDPPKASGLAELGEWTSSKEREAMGIERDTDAIASCFLLEAELLKGGFDEVFDGEVSGLIAAGAFVAFGSRDASEMIEGRAAPPPFEGMLPVRRLSRGDRGREWWEINEQGTILRGEREGSALRLGQAVSVQVSGVDSARGRVDLRLPG
jgi:ribonuclease R